MANILARSRGARCGDRGKRDEPSPISQIIHINNFSMLVRLFALLSFPLINAYSQGIVGTWQSDDRYRYIEIQFRNDHSFMLLSRTSIKRDELVIMTDLTKEFGTWYAEGNRLKIDSVRRPSNERKKVVVAFSLINDALKMQNIFDPSITDSYQRLNLPSCRNTSAVTRHSLREEDILGKWGCHYHTHDMEFMFNADHSAAVYGEGMEIFQGDWVLAGQALTITKRPRLPEKADSTLQWKITGKGTSCLTFDDGWPAIWTLQRKK
jgi:hypothetical protein